MKIRPPLPVLRMCMNYIFTFPRFFMSAIINRDIIHEFELIVSRVNDIEFKAYQA
jgi:hypothetical protein